MKQLLDVPSSEQQLVDCVTVDSGCNDELTNNGFAFQQEECHAHRATQDTDATS